MLLLTKKKVELALIIIRDPKGQVIETLRDAKTLKAKAFLVETYLVMVASKLWQDLGSQYILLEGNALHMVNALRKDESDWN